MNNNYNNCNNIQQEEEDLYNVIHKLIHDHIPWLTDDNTLNNNCDNIIALTREEIATKKMQDRKFMIKAEEAYWKYCDVTRKQNYRKYPAMKFKTFLSKFCIKSMPGFYPRIQRCMNDFSRFKKNMPVCCVAAVDMNNECIFVKGNTRDHTWMFPGGKQNAIDGETESECAIREMMEETGIDISAEILSNNYTYMIFCHESTLDEDNNQDNNLDKDINQQDNNLNNNQDMSTIENALDTTMIIDNNNVDNDDNTDNIVAKNSRNKPKQREYHVFVVLRKDPLLEIDNNNKRRKCSNTVERFKPMTCREIKDIRKFKLEYLSTCNNIDKSLSVNRYHDEFSGIAEIACNYIIENNIMQKLLNVQLHRKT